MVLSLLYKFFGLLCKIVHFSAIFTAGYYVSIVTPICEVP